MDKSCEFWGFSPSLNLSLLQNGENGNVLISGGVDGRHILEFLANPDRKQIFHIHERKPEAIARQLLFLLIAFDFEVAPPERSRIFLEIYGNTFLSTQSRDYMIQKAGELLDFLYGDTVDSVLNSICDLTFLKFKERDSVINVVNFWRSKGEFDIRKMWDDRLRRHYKERYDARTNLFDWDHTFNLKQHASIVHRKLYLHWRETGIAFEFGDRQYIHSNRTLSSFTKAFSHDQKGKVLPKMKSSGYDPCFLRGYWSDQMISPYFTFGVKSNNKELFKIHSGQHMKHTVHVAQDYVTDLFSKIEAKQDESISRITVLPMMYLDEKLLTRPNFAKSFDCVCLGSWSAHLLCQRMSDLLTANALIVLETPKYFASLNEEQKEGFIQKMKTRGEKSGFKCVYNETKAPEPCKGMLTPENYRIDNENRQDAYIIFASTNQI